MAKVYSAPNHIKVPSWSLSREEYLEAEDKYIEELKAFVKDRKPKGKNVGEVIRFPVADGYAQYMVASMRPLELVHIPLCDAYQFQYVNRITVKDVEDKIEMERSWAKLARR
jgi:hypothetical protein